MDFWIIWIVVTGFLGVMIFWVLGSLARSSSWSLADAVSEEAGNQPATLPPGEKPVMVASSSRLIALLGLLVLLAMFLGVGYYILWDLFKNQKVTDLGNITSFFYSAAAIFAPYAVNQLKEAFTAFAPPAPAQNPGVPALTVSAVALPDGAVGSAYSAVLDAAGGTPPYSWSLVGGSLPQGLTVNSAGAIGGTPAAAGSFSFTMQARDSSSAGNTAQKTFSIKVT